MPRLDTNTDPLVSRTRFILENHEPSLVHVGKKRYKPNTLFTHEGLANRGEGVMTPYLLPRHLRRIPHSYGHTRTAGGFVPFYGPRPLRPEAVQGLGLNVHTLTTWWEGVWCIEHLGPNGCSHTCWVVAKWGVHTGVHAVFTQCSPHTVFTHSTTHNTTAGSHFGKKHSVVMVCFASIEIQIFGCPKLSFRVRHHN